MKTKIALLFTLAIVSFSYSQESIESELSEEVKSKLIYVEVSDEFSNQQYQTTNGQFKSGPTSRKISIRFKKGIEGKFIKLDKKGNELKNIIKADENALIEFNKALEARNKMPYNNHAQIGCLIVAVPLGLIATVKYRNDKKANEYLEPGEVKQKSKGKLLAANGSLGALGGMYYFYFKTERLMDEYKKGILESIEIYNANIIANSAK